VRLDPADVGPQIAAIFDGASPFYDKSLPFFADFAADLVSWHRPPAEGRVLDLCTGSGACLQALADLVDAERLAGLDISPRMLAQARAALPGGIPLLQADAHRLPFAAGSFAAHYCAFSWQLLARPDLVLGELRRVSRGKASLTLSLLGRNQHTAHFMSKVLAEHIGTEQPRFASMLDELWRRPAEQALTAGGWHVLARDEVTRRFEFSDPAQWLTWQSSQVSRGYFDLVPADRRPGFYQQLLAGAQRALAGAGLWLEQTAVLLHAEPA
jgi:ubiquinone/menaquinone biosynthesis C-methylase UbiE